MLPNLRFPPTIEPQSGTGRMFLFTLEILLYRGILAGRQITVSRATFWFCFPKLDVACLMPHVYTPSAAQLNVCLLYTSDAADE